MSTKTAHADFDTRNGNNAHAPHVTAPHSHHASNSPPTPDPQSRSDQSNAAQPPFVGSALAEPPRTHAKPRGPHAEPWSDSDKEAHRVSDGTPETPQASASPPTPDPQSRSDQNNAAQPPFVGSAPAEPPSDSELEPPSECEIERPNESALENQSADEQCAGLEIEPPPDDRAIIAAHDPDRLLHALAVLDFSPNTLASELGVSPFSLLDWLESEETQRQLTRYQTIERQMLDLRALRSRRLTIESLEHVLETTQDLIEKRRTATTLLRLLTRTDHNRQTKTKSMAAQPPFHGSAPAEPPSDSERQEKRDGEPQKVRDELREVHSSQSQQDPAPERKAQTSSKRANQIESARGSGRDHMPERRDQNDANNPAAQPRFVGSANAEPTSDSEPPRVCDSEKACESEPQDVCTSAYETSDRQQPTTDQPRTTKIDWDAFFPEAFTGADRTPPTPHQRE